MIVVFVLIAVTPLHLSGLVIGYIRTALAVAGVFGVGARRLIKKKDAR